MSAYKHGRPIAVSGIEARAIESGEATALLRHARGVTLGEDGVALSPRRGMDHCKPRDVIKCPFARVGDALYGCEKWLENDAVFYRADALPTDAALLHWHRASSMQWWMSRFARVATSVQVVTLSALSAEQLGTITQGSAARVLRMNPSPYCWLIELGPHEWRAR